MALALAVSVEHTMDGQIPMQETIYYSSNPSYLHRHMHAQCAWVVMWYAFSDKDLKLIRSQITYVHRDVF